MFNAAVSKAPPTVFPELNELLLELVAQAGSILEDDFVGAYLTGSFALGAGDVHSDCDFLVVLGIAPLRRTSGRFASSTTRSQRVPAIGHTISRARMHRVPTS